MSIEKFIPKPKTKFLRIKCTSCGNEQTIFSAPASDVKCLVCNQVLGKSTASKVKLVKAKVLKSLE